MSKDKNIYDDWFLDEGGPYTVAGYPLGKFSGGPDWVDPRKRTTKSESPYGYSDFYIWRDNLDGSGADYSDRLAQHDYDKWKEACDAVPGKRISQFTRADASKFLTVYFGRDIKATGLIEGCNVSNGYPYWVFYYKDAPVSKKKSKKKED